MSLARLENEQSCAARRQLEQQRQQCAVRGSQQQHTLERQQQYWFSVCEGDSRGRTGDRAFPNRAECASLRTPAVARTKARQTRPVSRDQSAGNEYADGAGAGSVCESGRERPRAGAFQRRMYALKRGLTLVAVVAVFVGGSLRLPAEQGIGESSVFTLDTRYGLGVRSNQSGLFILDTRLSANTGIGASPNFTLDTRDAVIANAGINGNVRATIGGALSGVFVQARQSGIARASTFTDNSGHYQLALAAGTYELRASKTGWLTGIRNPLTISANQTVTQNFSLDSPPPVPVVENVNRTTTTAPNYNIPIDQLRVFVSGRFQSGIPLDRAKMTIVLTHGYNSSSDDWPTTMAGQLVAAQVDANICAWDWRDGARNNPNIPVLRNLDPFSISWGAPLQGEALGISLYDTLGSDYSHPIHFIGHSLGTLVNAAAANYLHGDAPNVNPPTRWLATRTHMTLLDDAKAAAVLGMNTFSEGFTGPIPVRAAWVDNYYSIFGSHRPGAINVHLTQAPLRQPSNIHGYPYYWYGLTIANPNDCILGNRYSFERMSEHPNFPSQAAFPYGSRWQQDTIFHPELDLIADPSFIEGVETVAGNVKAFVVQTYNGTVKIVNGTVQAIGNVGAGIGEKVFNAINAFSLQISLQTSPLPIIASEGGPSASGADDVTNSPPYAWLNISVPTNSALLEFDFTLTGDGSNDYFVAGVNGTNIFALETRFIPQDTTLSSGAIDFSMYAGQTVELFFGVTGGTSANASLTVDGIRFYSIQPPSLSVSVAAGQAVISWPVAASGYLLESALDFANPTGWSPVTNAPGLFDFQYAVTNTIVGDQRFFRLRKQ